MIVRHGIKLIRCERMTTLKLSERACARSYARADKLCDQKTGTEHLHGKGEDMMQAQMCHRCPTGKSNFDSHPGIFVDISTRRNQGRFGQLRQHILSYLMRPGGPHRRKDILRASPNTTCGGMSGTLTALLKEGLVVRVREGYYELSERARPKRGSFPAKIGSRATCNGGGTRLKLTDSRLRQIRRMRQDGATHKAIAQEVGLHHQTVQKALKKMELT